MTDSEKTILLEFYNKHTIYQRTVVEKFIEQFDEKFVDSNLITFDEFVHHCDTHFVGDIHATIQSDIVLMCSYPMNRTDYEQIKNYSITRFLVSNPSLVNYDDLNNNIATVTSLSRIITIKVHFPRVRVTNEYDKFIDIYDLYVKLEVNRNGMITNTPQFLKTTYTYAQFSARYIHSHIPSLSYYDIEEWKYPCLGTGPINQTVHTLSSRFDEQLWGLFTYELSKYVTVESVAGIPYYRLEDVAVNAGDNVAEIPTLRKSYYSAGYLNRHKLDDFIKYCANKNLFKFKFVNNQYLLGENYTDFIIHISNAFIEYLNTSTKIIAPGLTELEADGTLVKVSIKDNKIYFPSTDREDSVTQAYERYQNRELLKFKGKSITLKILDYDDYTNYTNLNYTLILDPIIVAYIASTVLNIINCRYGKEYANTESESGSQKNKTGEKFYLI